MAGLASSFLLQAESALESFVEEHLGDMNCWLLGVKYDVGNDGGKEQFLMDFKSHIWVTYRRNFMELVPSPVNRPLTSDGGWGCMIRSGQMMLAEALLRKRLGRDWRIASTGTERARAKKGKQQSTVYSLAHKRTLLHFVDVPHINCDFSIHRIVQAGLQYGKNPGDWYGPETISVVLRDLVNMNSHLGVIIHVAHGSLVVRDDILKICNGAKVSEERSGVKDNSQWANELLLIIPLRLGLHSINSIYADSLCGCLEFPQTVGFIGGKPRHSVYYVGHQGKMLKYMDPHTVQNTVHPGMSFPTIEDLLTYHCMTPRSMKVSDIDPSLALGFVIRNEHDFDDFSRRVQDMFARHTPIFELIGHFNSPSRSDGASSVSMAGAADDDEDEWMMM
jgi:cysteine protease ATG4